MSSLLDTSLLGLAAIVACIACLVVWRRTLLRDQAPTIEPTYDDTEDEPLSAPPSIERTATPPPKLRGALRQPIRLEGTAAAAPLDETDHDDEYTDPRCTGKHADLDRVDAKKKPIDDVDDEDSQVSA